MFAMAQAAQLSTAKRRVWRISSQVSTPKLIRFTALQIVHATSLTHSTPQIHTTILWWNQELQQYRMFKDAPTTLPSSMALWMLLIYGVTIQNQPRQHKWMSTTQKTRVKIDQLFQTVARLQVWWFSWIFLDEWSSQINVLEFAVQQRFITFPT